MKKDARLKQIEDENSKTIERELRDKIQHITAELDIEEDTPAKTTKELLLKEWQEQLEAIENNRPKASIAFEGRINIRLSSSEGFYLYSDETGNIDKGEYWVNEWDITSVEPLLDAETQSVMDYFNIDDSTYSIRG